MKKIPLLAPLLLGVFALSSFGQFSTNRPDIIQSGTPFQTENTNLLILSGAGNPGANGTYLWDAGDVQYTNAADPRYLISELGGASWRLKFQGALEFTNTSPNPTQNWYASPGGTPPAPAADFYTYANNRVTNNVPGGGSAAPITYVTAGSSPVFGTVSSPAYLNTAAPLYTYTNSVVSTNYTLLSEPGTFVFISDPCQDIGQNPVQINNTNVYGTPMWPLLGGLSTGTNAVWWCPCTNGESTAPLYYAWTNLSGVWAWTLFPTNYPPNWLFTNSTFFGSDSNDVASPGSQNDVAANGPFNCEAHPVELYIPTPQTNTINAGAAGIAFDNLSLTLGEANQNQTNFYPMGIGMLLNYGSTQVLGPAYLPMCNLDLGMSNVDYGVGDIVAGFDNIVTPAQDSSGAAPGCEGNLVLGMFDHLTNCAGGLYIGPNITAEFGGLYFAMGQGGISNTSDGGSVIIGQGLVEGPQNNAHGNFLFSLYGPSYVTNDFNAGFGNYLRLGGYGYAFGQADTVAGSYVFGGNITSLNNFDSPVFSCPNNSQPFTNTFHNTVVLVGDDNLVRYLPSMTNTAPAAGAYLEAAGSAANHNDWYATTNLGTLINTTVILPAGMTNGQTTNYTVTLAGCYPGAKVIAGLPVNWPPTVIPLLIPSNNAVVVDCLCVGTNVNRTTNSVNLTKW